MAACALGAGCTTDSLAPEARLEVSIVTPRDGELISHLIPIRLEADGRDPSSGPLPDSAFSWSSHRDGTLGSGRVLPEVRLTPGAHLLTAVATAPGMLPESATVAVGVDSAGVGSLRWITPIPGEVSVGQMALAPNGDIVLVFGTGDGIAAVDQAGTVRWVRHLGLVIQSAPAVGPDGTIYLGVWGNLNGVLALNPDGSERWRFSTRPNSPLTSSVYWHVHGAPAVLPDGSLRVVSEEDDSPMYALNPDGSLAWRLGLQAGRFIGSVVVAADGSAYAMNPNDSLYAVSAVGQRQWAVKLQAITYWEMPAMDAAGNLYTTSARPLYFLDSYWGVLERTSPAGSVTASLNVPTVCSTDGSPAIASDGRILLGRTDGSVVAAAPDLTTAELWTQQGARAYDWREPGVSCSAAPAAARGAVYNVSLDMLWAYNLDGTLRFAAEVRGARQRGDSPLIGADGTVYVQTSGGVAAVYDTLGVDPQSPWPMYQGGNGRWGRKQ
jgi:hypothetical protein